MPCVGEYQEEGRHELKNRGMLKVKENNLRRGNKEVGGGISC